MKLAAKIGVLGLTLWLLSDGALVWAESAVYIVNQNRHPVRIETRKNHPRARWHSEWLSAQQSKKIVLLPQEDSLILRLVNGRLRYRHFSLLESKRYGIVWSSILREWLVVEIP